MFNEFKETKGTESGTEGYQKNKQDLIANSKFEKMFDEDFKTVKTNESEGWQEDVPNKVKDESAKSISDGYAKKTFEDLVSSDFKETIEVVKQDNSEVIALNESNEADETTEQKGLTDDEKQQIREETGWSDKIIDSIQSMEEAQIYKNAGLVEKEVNGRIILMRDDIDWEQKDELGRTNRERVSATPPDGFLSPINKNGDTIELHHIGQKPDSPFAELTRGEHRQNGNYSILHDTSKRDSEIDRDRFGNEKKEHWQERQSIYEKGGN